MTKSLLGKMIISSVLLTRKVKYLRSALKVEDLILFTKTCKPIYEISNRSNRELYERLANKPNDPNTSSKTYWSIIKTLANGKKFLVTPPILVNNKLVTDFTNKANIFNDFFSKHFQPIPNNSTLPSIQTSFRLDTVDIDSKKILKFTQGLNSNKAHGHNGISITMLKLCRRSIIKPLSVI